MPRLTLGTNVLVLPQRHPILVAKQAAALHLLSEGRLILGVGIGWRAEEFALLGADFANRAAVTDEAIEVLRALWREPSPVTRAGSTASMPPACRRIRPTAGRRSGSGGTPLGGDPADSPLRRRLAALCHGRGRLSIRRGGATGPGAGATESDYGPHVLLPHREGRRARGRAINDPVDA